MITYIAHCNLQDNCLIDKTMNKSAIKIEKQKVLNTNTQKRKNTANKWCIQTKTT